jgi:ribonuclease BN (tRNA processing enzyme)
VLLFSHFHHDHIQGFPFFQPAFLPQARLHLFGPGAAPETLERVLEGNQSPLNFPVALREMAAAKSFHSVRAFDTILWDDAGVRLAMPGAEHTERTIVVRIHHSHAHPGGVYVYRIDWRGRSVVYASDTEAYAGADCRLAHFARAADLLIHDAQYTEAHYAGRLPGFPSTQGYGHSTIEMACEAARAAGAGQLCLFHHDPAYDDARLVENEAHARELFTAVVMAHEGLQIPVRARALAPVGSDVKYAAHG